MYHLISNQNPNILKAYRKINNPANYDTEEVHYWDGEWYIRCPENDIVEKGEQPCLDSLQP